MTSRSTPLPCSLPLLSMMSTPAPGRDPKRAQISYFRGLRSATPSFRYIWTQRAASGSSLNFHSIIGWAAWGVVPYMSISTGRVMSDFGGFIIMDRRFYYNRSAVLP